MGTEIERKWLVKKDFNIVTVPNYYKCWTEHIIQGYITDGGNGNEVRIRKVSDDYYLTVKHGSGLVRQEYEIQITENQFNKLLPTVGDVKLSKTRFKLPYMDDSYTIEIDVYNDRLVGLVVAEVEFNSVEQAESFKQPDWFDIDITENEYYKNFILAKFGLIHNASWLRLSVSKIPQVNVY